LQLSFSIAKKIVIDTVSPSDQEEIAMSEHHRAYRNAHENFNQAVRDYYFPELSAMFKNITQNCRICKQAKYDRHQKKVFIEITPISSRPGEILHIDIFYTDRDHFLKCLDKFSKCAIVLPILSRSIFDIKIQLLTILNFYPVSEVI